MAARRSRVPLFVAEQNASAGLANRIASRWAARTFGSFPATEGLPGAEWVGNPVRRAFWDFDRAGVREAALKRYDLDGDLPVVGVFGGSLGSGVINSAIGAAYYLRIAAACYLGAEVTETRRAGGIPMRLGVALAAISMLFFFAAPGPLSSRSQLASAGLNRAGVPSLAAAQRGEYDSKQDPAAP